MNEDSLCHHFDEMGWPVPGARLDELERSLRYGPRKNLGAAMVLAAYRELVTCRAKKRTAIIRELSAEMERRGDSNDSS